MLSTAPQLRRRALSSAAPTGRNLSSIFMSAFPKHDDSICKIDSFRKANTLQAPESINDMHEATFSGHFFILKQKLNENVGWNLNNFFNHCKTVSRNFLSDEPDRNLFHAIKRDKMFIKFHNNYDVMNEMAALSFELENFYGSNCSSRNFIVHSSLFLKLLAELFSVCSSCTRLASVITN